jgi:hypothetical protein
MWWALQKHKVSTKYITIIKDMYDNVVTSVRTSDGDTNDFPINIGLHQGSALSPYLLVPSFYCLLSKFFFPFFSPLFAFFLLSVLLSFLLLSNWFLFLSSFVFPLLF